MKLRGWRPGSFTPTGQPQIDETILGALVWPEAKLLSEYLLIEKRIGQIATGKEAWLRHAKRSGIYGTDVNIDLHRIHGKVNTNGAVTGRMTHSKPNVAQTPRIGTPYGAECRACFIAPPGFVLVGCDAEGIELRMLAHYMALYDGGEYARTVVEGKKEDRTDVHSVNQRAIGMNERVGAKTFVYALIYGAGDFKLGLEVLDDFTAEQKAKFHVAFPTKAKRGAALKNLGGARRARLMKNLPALGKLIAAVRHAVKTRGYLKGLDGRLLHVRSEHAALNTLLQSAAAVAMKKALVLLDGSYEGDVPLVANIHDEWQMESTNEKAEALGSLAADCIRRAGVSFNLRCPLSGSYGIGPTWAATH